MQSHAGCVDGGAEGGDEGGQPPVAAGVADIFVRFTWTPTFRRREGGVAVAGGKLYDSRLALEAIDIDQRVQT